MMQDNLQQNPLSSLLVVIDSTDYTFREYICLGKGSDTCIVISRPDSKDAAIKVECTHSTEEAGVYE